MRKQSETLHIDNDLINKDHGSFSCYASENWRTFLKAIFATMRVRGFSMTDAGSTGSVGIPRFRMQAICWGHLSLLVAQAPCNTSSRIHNYRASRVSRSTIRAVKMRPMSGWRLSGP